MGKDKKIIVETEVFYEEEVMHVNELVPVQMQIDNNMERIADMKEHFSQTIDPILRMYNAAMSVTTAKKSNSSY